MTAVSIKAWPLGCIPADFFLILFLTSTSTVQVMDSLPSSVLIYLLGTVWNHNVNVLIYYRVFLSIGGFHSYEELTHLDYGHLKHSFIVNYICMCVQCIHNHIIKATKYSSVYFLLWGWGWISLYLKGRIFFVVVLYSKGNKVVPLLGFRYMSLLLLLLFSVSTMKDCKFW